MPVKITRAAFLYIEPRGDGKSFAQCSSCPMWKTAKHNLCSIHGEGLVVHGQDTCGLYVEGMPMEDAPVHKFVTPEESGFERRQVRCENCVSFKRGQCNLYVQLNHMDPGTYYLDPRVKAKACCNANRPKGSAGAQAKALHG